ncbi:conserved hypothetical protein [Coccidioides posadasii str. Silveira]|uniref:Uncharacterized protein n=2 Tax=Coccidioides posadasii TaxID=199306 RepID=E9D864_COCPS|nr:conserved hypothetical protein [Coccidioides posadasii str. Silveira]KMM70778.1 hypothetical protein CPAG_07089 [Coccidioides posadasii RMSCC 3488]
MARRGLVGIDLQSKHPSFARSRDAFPEDTDSLLMVRVSASASNSTSTTLYVCTEGHPSTTVKHRSLKRHRISFEHKNLCGGKMEDAWNHFILRGVGLASGRGPVHSLFTSALKRAGESRMWPFMYPPARTDLQNPQRMICATGNRRALIRGRSHSTVPLFSPKPRR